MKIFLNEDHRKKFHEYIGRVSKERKNSTEYQSLLFLLSSNEDIVNHIDDVFNFEESGIEPYSYSNHGWQTSSSLKTTRLAYNLFNNNRLDGSGSEENMDLTILDIFDNHSYYLYAVAIGIRLGNISIDEMSR